MAGNRVSRIRVKAVGKAPAVVGATTKRAPAAGAERPVSKKRSKTSKPKKKLRTKKPVRAAKAVSSRGKLNAQERAARVTTVLRTWAAEVERRLVQAIPDARCELEFRNPFELLIATILASQSTDKGVNSLSPALFAKYPDAAALSAAVPRELEPIIRSTGYYRQKGRYIKETARLLCVRHGGTVPADFEALLALPGVARKTANVVLGTAFRVPTGVVVDTHGIRVSHRLGFLGKRPRPVDLLAENIEIRLMTLFPKEQWIDVGHRLTLLGRYTCTAARPRCGRCVMLDQCPTEEAALVRARSDDYSAPAP